jgi:hypothetical protein
MLDPFLAWWHRLPTWGTWAAVILCLLSVDAIRMAWGDRRPVGAFFEALVALLIYWGAAIGLFVGGIWGGVKVAERSSFLGWVAGFAIYVAVAAVVFSVSAHIPGVGWRVDRLMQSRDDDY